MQLIKSPIAIALTLAFNLSSLELHAEENNSQAEKDVEVITINSTFRATQLQNIPASLSILSQDDNKSRNAQNLEEVIGLVPNVNFSSGSQRARYYQIRGIGERSQFQEPINPSVGIIIDDIDFSGIGSIASTFDIAQTEVYRGPQGTRFGATALAGLIYMNTNAPSDEFESSMRLTAGNFNSFGAGVVVSGPANDAINYRFSAEQYTSDGFIENTYLNKEDTNGRDELSLRGKLSIQASDDLTIDLSMLYFDFDNGYDAFSLDNTRKTLSDEPGFDDQETFAGSAKFTYQGFDRFELISIFTHADSDLAYGYDEDWSNETLCQINECPWGDYSSTDYYFRDKQTSTAEFRLLSKPGHELFSGSTAWVTGVYAKQEQEDLSRQYTYLESDFNSEFKATSLAAFVELETRFSEKFTLTTGLRYEQRNSDYDNSDSFAFSPTEDMIGGKVVLSYQITEQSLTYVSANRGYKAGGVNTDGTLPDNLRAFEPEYLWNYEFGFKTSFLNESAYLRTAVFYMQRDEIQISTYSSVLRSDGSTEFTSYVDNAGQGYNQGIEIDGAWNITDDIELYGALGLLDTEFSDFTYEDGSIETGKEQAHAPNYQYNLGINYYPSEQWLVNVAVDGKDEFYFSDTHTEKSQATTLLHASVSYLQDNWQVKLWARNILDKTYATRGFYFGNDPRDLYDAKAYYQYGEPAVFGLSLDYQF